MKNKFYKYALSISILFFLQISAERVVAQTWNKNVPAQTTINMLQGGWFNEESADLGSAIFYINGDSLQDLDTMDKFKLLISKDTFDIKDAKPHYVEIILKLTSDSLIVRDIPNKKMENSTGGKIVRYWKNN